MVEQRCMFWTHLNAPSGRQPLNKTLMITYFLGTIVIYGESLGGAGSQILINKITIT